MNQAVQHYLEYSAFIKELKAERKEKIIKAIRQAAMEQKSKLGRFKKQKLKKFKSMLRDIDLRIQNTAAKIEQNKLKIEIKIIKKANRFKTNVERKINKVKKKVNRFKKEQIRKFKKTIKKIQKQIDIKIIKKVTRFKTNVVRKTRQTKNKIGRFKNKQIKKFKSKISTVFKSSDKSRQNQIDKINARKAKIEELRKYRNELLNYNAQTMEPVAAGRSRGILYIWMAAIFSVLSMMILIGISLFKG